MNQYTPLIEHQRRLNISMKEVLKKEVLKWLYAGFIYAILDSSWVSQVLVVPNKGGECVLIIESSIRPQGRITSPCLS